MFKKIIILLLSIFALSQAAFKISGDAVRLLGDKEQPFRRPLWSADGRYIACTGEQDRGIWLLRIQDRELRQLSDDPAAGFGVAWSRDGKSLVSRVAKYENNHRYNAIKLFDVESSSSQFLCSFQTRSLGLPVWAFDDSRVYVSTEKKLRSYATGKTNLALQKTAPQNLAYLMNDKLVIHNPSTQSFTQKLAEQRVINLVTSVDGRRLAFEIMGGPMCVMNSDGSGYRELGEGHRPQWSPDGEFLVYMITQDDGHDYISSDLFVIKTDGTEKQALTTTGNKMEMNPSWSPEGNQIAYDDLTDGAIFILSLSRE